MEYIVTHGYTAHYDEILAIGLATIRWGPLPVYRRSATGDELENPEIAVIDTGGEHDAAKFNWDHHQFEQSYTGPDGIPDCAFSLLARDFGTEPVFIYSSWYRKLRRIDARGGYAWARSVGLTLPIPREILSDAISLGIRLEFEKCWGGRTVPKDLVVFLGTLVTNLMDHGKKLCKEVEAVRTFGQVINVGGTEGIQGIWVDFVTDIGMLEYIAELRKKGQNIAFTVNRNSDGTWLVYRIDNCPRLNLNVLEGMSEVKVINNRGKFVKLRGDVSITRVKELIEEAVSKPRSTG